MVVRKDPGLTEQALLDHCRLHLTGYKVPRFVEFSAEPLPKSAIGKMLRRQVRDASRTSTTVAAPALAADGGAAGDSTAPPA